MGGILISDGIEKSSAEELKKVGPARVTLAVIRKDLLGKALDITPTMFNYKTHADENSMFNTPPAFGIYICKLVFERVKEMGGVAASDDLVELKGHRLVGSMRANIYNAMSTEGVIKLANFMMKFEAEN